ncbi:efflux RND transporter periplasmic adaptor subunit [Leptothrix sp. BB-4]
MTPDAPTQLALLQALRAAATPAERRFVLLNRSREVLPYHAAVLWQAATDLFEHSGVSSIDRHGPYALWLKKLLLALEGRPPGPVELPELAGDLAGEGADWWPPHLLWLPGATADEAALLLVREVPWTQDEIDGLAHWAGLWRLNERAAGASRRRFVDPGALWAAWRRPSASGGWRGWLRPGRWLLLALVGLAFLPVPMTLRAPGELVPREPTVVRAAMEGTLRRLLVEPNQVVQAGQVLAEFDDEARASRLQVARQAVATAAAEWRQLNQQALADARAKAQLPAAQGKLGQAQTELKYLEQQMQRVSLVAPHDGVVLIDDPGSWAGRNLQAGEAVMRLAQPRDQELEAWLAVGDAIDLAPGAAMALHLASRPGEPVLGRLRLYAYEAEHRPDGTLAYRLRGTLDDAASERLGARGTVRISGPRAPLAYVMLRRPLAALRELTGW